MRGQGNVVPGSDTVPAGFDSTDRIPSRVGIRRRGVLGLGMTTITTDTTDTGSDPIAIQGGVSKYDAKRRAASKIAVDGGGEPVRRMSAPGAVRRAGCSPDATGVVPFWLSKHGLVCVMPGEEPQRATAEIAANAFSLPHLVAAPVDRASLRAMVSMCRKAGEVHKTTARLIDFASRLPISSHLLVLTDALARTFWMPAGRAADDIENWRIVFGAPSGAAGLLALAARVYDEGGVTGRQGGYFKALLQSEDAAVKSVSNRGASAAAAAFSASNAISEAWSAVERTDSILRERFLHTGEVVKVRPLHTVPGGVVARVSTPFRLRTGGVIVIDESRTGDTGERVLDATLTDLGFDDGLLAVFGGSEGGIKRSGRSHGVTAMLAAMAARDTLLVTAAPYLGKGRSSSVWRWASSGGLEGVDVPERDLPFDVALAGAPYEAGDVA